MRAFPPIHPSVFFKSAYKFNTFTQHAPTVTPIQSSQGTLGYHVCDLIYRLVFLGPQPSRASILLSQSTLGRWCRPQG